MLTLGILYYFLFLAMGGNFFKGSHGSFLSRPNVPFATRERWGIEGAYLRDHVMLLIVLH